MTESRKTLEPAEPSLPSADRESPVAPRSDRVLADHGASRASARADDHTPTSVRSTRESIARESVTEPAVAPEHAAPEASDAREVSEPGLPSAVIVSGVPVAPLTPGRVTSTKRYKFMRGKLRWLFLLALCPAVFGLAYRAHEVSEPPSHALTVDSKAGESAPASIA